jgi:hypothetical protein
MSVRWLNSRIRDLTVSTSSDDPPTGARQGCGRNCGGARLFI